MTYEQAITFFKIYGYSSTMYGNPLSEICPSEESLTKRARLALAAGCQAEETDDAVTAIKAYWKQKGCPVISRYNIYAKGRVAVPHAAVDCLTLQHPDFWATIDPPRYSDLESKVKAGDIVDFIDGMTHGHLIRRRVLRIEKPGDGTTGLETFKYWYRMVLEEIAENESK